MRKITVTFEKTFRVQEEYTISEEDYEDIEKNKFLPSCCEELIKRLPAGILGNMDIETNFSVKDEEEKVLIDWD